MAAVMPGAGTRSVNGSTAGLDVGDEVDVPGGMHGTVKFIGNVKGKNGVFAGVELSSEYAQRGKNDGDVDGVQYFTTSVPRSGIFLPITRASKRASPTSPSVSSFPLSPSTPSMGSVNSKPQTGQQSTGQQGQNPPTPSLPNLRQPVGPARTASQRRYRPSLPRPESPVRRQQNTQSTPAGRPSLGVGGLTTPRPGGSRNVPTPTPGRIVSTTLKPKRNSNSYSGDPGKRYGATAISESTAAGGRRAQSALGNRSSRDMDSEAAYIGVAQTSNINQKPALMKEINSLEAALNADEEIANLKAKLEERDKQLREQATSLAEMEGNIKLLEALLPPSGPTIGESKNSSEEADVPHLRQALREKTQKIAMLTAEFDAHRADFRSTIETLELASTETQRVYEKRVDELVQEIKDLREGSGDVESVAVQLKQLEGLVQELEEGLEQARRGEAEARGEVEFLRGEVERGRSELKREREKAAAAQNGAGATVNGGSPNTSLEKKAKRELRQRDEELRGAKREIKQKDEELRGLKAIIHSISRDSISAEIVDRHGQPNAFNAFARFSERISEDRCARACLELQVTQLQTSMLDYQDRERQLRHELEDLREAHQALLSQQRKSTSDDPSKDNTASNMDESHPPTQTNDTVKAKPETETNVDPSSTNEVKDDAPLPWCMICDKEGHDISTCTNIDNQSAPASPQEITSSPSSPTTQPSKAEEEAKKQPTTTPTLTKNDSPTFLTPTQPSTARVLLPKRGRDLVLDTFARGAYPQKSTISQRYSSMSSASSEELGSPARIAANEERGRAAAIDAQQRIIAATAAEWGVEIKDLGLVAGKKSGSIDPHKWCALCENDGHECIDCPLEGES